MNLDTLPVSCSNLLQVQLRISAAESILVVDYAI